MVIELKPNHEQRLREIADKSGQSVAEIVESAIERVIQERSELLDAKGKMSPDVKADMLARIEEIRNLPDDDIKDDPYCSENHDRYIYRIDW